MFKHLGNTLACAFITSAVLLAAEPQPAQTGNAAQQLKTDALTTQNCLTPTGTTFSESFGDAASGACGFNGNSGCNWPWHQNGSGASIIVSPGAPAANTACGSSLQMVTGTANNYINIVGPTPT